MKTQDAKRYTFGDKTLSLKEWSSELGIKEVTLRRRLNKGWRVEDILGRPVDTRKAMKSKARLLTMNGVTKTMAEWCRELGLSRSAVAGRIKAGKSEAEALSIPLPPKPKFALNGREQTLLQWAKEYGLPRECVHARMQKGMSLRDALETPLNFRHRVITCGDETHCVADWAKLLGMSRALLCERLNSGWPVEEALTAPVVRVEPKMITWKGETHTIPQWGKITGLGKNKIRSRILLGWDLDRVFAA